MSKKKDNPNPFVSILIDDAHYKTHMLKKYEQRKKWIKADDRIVKALIPGTINKVHIKEGDEVVVGQTLLVLEAMKMFNQILSPRNGTILKIHVNEGERVPKDQVLLEIDCPENIIEDI